MSKKPISLKRAKELYQNRYTLEHIPTWASKPCPGNGKYYAPQYRTDKEWYECTTFPEQASKEDHCMSSGQTWPLGEWLDAPLKI